MYRNALCTWRVASSQTSLGVRSSRVGGGEGVEKWMRDERTPKDSLRSRRLEVAGERENERARGRHATCLLLARRFFLVPTTSKRLLRRLPKGRLRGGYLYPWHVRWVIWSNNPKNVTLQINFVWQVTCALKIVRDLISDMANVRSWLTFDVANYKKASL